MAFSRFGTLLAIRLFFLMVSLAAVGFLVITPGQHAATLLAAGVTISLTIEYRGNCAATAAGSA